MAKYAMTVEIDAEQFLPQENKIPSGVISDGPRTPRTDPRASWVLRTPEGMVYLTDGDYVVTTAMNGQYRVPQDKFERDYKALES